MAGRRFSRREFLYRSAAAGVLGVHALRNVQAQVLGSNERINIGLVGVGGRGSALLGELLRIQKDGKQNMAVVAVCDVYARRVEEAARRCEGKPYAEYQDLLAHPDLNAVVIATPDHWHARISIDAMKAGKDVYCEKPMTLYWEEAKEVARVARETKRVTQIGAGSASDDRYWQANRVIREGGIGKTIWTQSGSFRNDTAGDWNWPIDKNAGPNKSGADHIDWKRWLGSAPDRPFDPERFFRFRKYWDYSGGQATDLLYHTLSHLVIALGPEFPKRVTASGGNYVFTLENDNREAPDSFYVLIDYPTNHTVALISTQVNENRVPEMIRGQKASIQFVRDFRNQADKGYFEIIPEPPFKKEIEARRVDPQPRADHMENFLECVRTRQECHLNAQTGYKVMVPIGLSVKAYRENKVMLFDPEKEEVIG
jgi:predicted dehydrogenase